MPRTMTEALLPFAGLTPAYANPGRFPTPGGYDRNFIQNFVSLTKPEHDPFSGTVSYLPAPDAERITIPQEEFFEVGPCLPNFRGQTFEFKPLTEGPFANPDWAMLDHWLVCLPLKKYQFHPGHGHCRYLEYLGYEEVWDIAHLRGARMQRNPDGTVDNPTRERIWFNPFGPDQILIDSRSLDSIPAFSENNHV